MSERRRGIPSREESGYQLVSRSKIWHAVRSYDFQRHWSPFDMVKRRKSRVPPPPAECPLGDCMRVLAGAWTAHVIWYLRGGERCFTELQLDIGKVSAKILT